MSVSGISAQK